MPRRAARKDSTQRAIASVWAGVGWQVIDTSAMGQHCAGFPDFLATRWPLTIWVECKTPGGQVRHDQTVFAAALSAPYVVCYSAEDAQRQAEEWRDRADDVKGRW